MRRKRNLIRRYATTVILTAVATSPCVSLLAQELNPPQVPPLLSSLPSLKTAPAERSVTMGNQDNGLRSESARIEDSDIYTVAMQTDTPSEQTASQTVVAAELLQQRTANGKIHIERWVAEDAIGNLVNHGLYKEYDAKGAIVRTGNFWMGKLDGVWKQTIPVATAQRIADTIDSGFRPPFHSEANFVSGKIEGDWTLADSVGNAVAVWQFENNVRSGASVWLSSRGKAVREINYRNGAPDGSATRFLSTQKEPEKFMYYQGKVLKSRTVWYDPDRKTKKQLEESILISEGDQIVSHDWWNSQINSQPLPTGEPLRHGTLTAWHANGTKSVEGQFLHNQPVGEFQWWYPSGQLQSKGVYAEGDMTGTWAWWYPNGMKMLVGDYSQGEQMGVWSQWAADGKLVQRDEAGKFPAVKQDILPPSEPVEDVAKASRGSSNQYQYRRATTTNSGRR